MQFSRITFVSVVVALLTLTGCTFSKILIESKMKPPKVTYSHHKVTGVTEKSATVDVFFKADNPNEVGLINVFVNYRLAVEGKRFFSGKDISVKLKPKGVTELKVPVKVVYKDAFKVLGKVAETIILDEKTIPVRVDATIYGKPTAYNQVESGTLPFKFKMDISQTIDVPLPEKEIDAAKKKLKKELKKLF